MARHLGEENDQGKFYFFDEDVSQLPRGRRRRDSTNKRDGGREEREGCLQGGILLSASSRRKRISSLTVLNFTFQGKRESPPRTKKVESATSSAKVDSKEE